MMTRRNKQQLKLPPSLDPDDRYISVREIAAWFGVCEDSIRREREAGRFPLPIRIGRALRWRMRDVRDWLEQQK